MYQHKFGALTLFGCQILGLGSLVLGSEVIIVSPLQKLDVDLENSVSGWKPR